MSKCLIEKVKIDGGFLKTVLEERGMTAKKASDKIGRGHDCVSRMIRENLSNLSDALAVCCALDISKDDLIVVEPEVVEVVPEPTTDNSDILSELQKMNKTLDDIANCFAVMAKLYERAWIDKE